MRHPATSSAGVAFDAPATDQKLLGEVNSLEAAGKTTAPRYMEVLIPMHYEQHILRRP
ncbi:hypothetical protein [Phenylobacterium montanum]|uniref:Uncharacterized protein n=1 Tax=Phenylobacterium montanum TaxID=2823693 RepID=A0A975FUZ0_9CAUL|nr:hypothetical protein [Caulobacter sp. S6]QUD85963.1 hypothetical protein KCG34_12680 [Caulobacter sp. S6]